MIKRILFYQLRFIVMLLSLIILVSGKSLAATFYLIRHAEKQLGDDPQLTQQGEQRAQRIARLLSIADIEVIYSTNYHRTQTTAKPIADIKSLPVIIYDAGDLDSFAKQLLKENKNAVIVGHSNTTPDLVRLLSQQTVPDMDEASFHLIYQVVTFCDSPGQRAVVNLLNSD